MLCARLFSPAIFHSLNVRLVLVPSVQEAKVFEVNNSHESPLAYLIEHNTLYKGGVVTAERRPPAAPRMPVMAKRGRKSGCCALPVLSSMQEVMVVNTTAPLCIYTCSSTHRCPLTMNCSQQRGVVCCCHYCHCHCSCCCCRCHCH